MQIYIGDEPLQFELEKNTPFSEILSELTEWASSQKFYIVDYHIEAKPGFENNERLSSDEIETLRVNVGSQEDLIDSNLRELIDYTDRVGFHVANLIETQKSPDEKDASELKTAWAFVVESVDALSQHLEAQDRTSLKNAVSVLTQVPDLIEKLNALAIIQNQLKLWLRQTEFSRISKEEAIEQLVEFRKRQDALNQDLEQIAAKLTQGKEQEALTLLEPVSQILVDAVLLMQIAEDSKYKDAQKLVELLGQLTAAIDQRDLVTAADIVDFDLRDLLKAVA